MMKVRGVPCTLPRAFITDGTDLYQVIGKGKADMLVVEDCSNGHWSEIAAWRVRAKPWYLVREAPFGPFGTGGPLRFRTGSDAESSIVWCIGGNLAECSVAQSHRLV